MTQSFEQTSHRDFECSSCGRTVAEGDPFFFKQNMRLCRNCAEELSVWPEIKGGAQ